MDIKRKNILLILVVILQLLVANVFVLVLRKAPFSNVQPFTVIELVTSDVLLRITATNPKDIQIFDEYTTSDVDGVFALSIPISTDAEIGNYSIQVTSQCREIHREVCTHQYESLSINVEGESNQNEIPSWIRNNAAWWADGMISDFDFVKGIEYLVGSGTIRVQTSSQIDPPSLEIDAGPSDDSKSENTMCLGNARCISGTVTKIVDGDTIQVDDEIIRFALVDAPKIKYDGGQSLGFIDYVKDHRTDLLIVDYPKLSMEEITLFDDIINHIHHKSHCHLLTMKS